MNEDADAAFKWQCQQKKEPQNNKKKRGSKSKPEQATSGKKKGEAERKREEETAAAWAHACAGDFNRMPGIWHKQVNLVPQDEGSPATTAAAATELNLRPKRPELRRLSVLRAAKWAAAWTKDETKRNETKRKL